MADITLLDAQLVIARLDAQVASLKQVAGAADFAAAAPDARLLPAAFVLELTNRPGQNLVATTMIEQRNEIRFGIVLAVQNLRDPRGERASADMKTLREAVMTALLGWEPGAVYDPVEYAGGRLLQLDNQVLWWQDDYLTRIYERS